MGGATLWMESAHNDKETKPWRGKERMIEQ